MSKAINHLRS